ncbi:hypothetical protein O6H91_16G030400 [Diphasiastrum complanatum]|uniref:Uncharacterized protein n=1 Tax=Diphasiastrum complanatum TaxID=34168 RepID=A0ACC2BB39_DIPCM|nr:hypothetical protein O6H91_16G030400 [Diphasiastrum complanatum]
MAVGVLALQGAFHEHTVALKKLGVEAVEVRKPEDLEGLLGLIIPGGESTTMSKLAEQYKLFPALKEFEITGKPIWGTCAGLIFLADRAVGQKAGGQALLGGLDCTVHRNFFGSQLNSFEAELPVPSLVQSEGGPSSFRAVFIRAPAIIQKGESVEVLAYYDVSSTLSLEGDEEARLEGQSVAVAVKQGNLLATAFHPELTSDTRWHSYFLKMVQKSGDLVNVSPKQTNPLVKSRSQLKDLPVFRGTDYLSLETQ